MPLTDVGTITELQRLPERRAFDAQPVVRYVAKIASGAGGAFEKDTTSVNGRLIRMFHRPIVNPTALSDLEIYDREVLTDTLLGVVDTWTDGITTSPTSRILAAPQPAFVGRLRLKVVNNIVATYEGELHMIFATTGSP
jgi:hypothetical protein